LPDLDSFYQLSSISLLG